jgi:antitoxin YobK
MCIEDAFKLIDKRKKNNDFVGNISHRNILKAEQMLNVTFPISYKKFLEKYGCGGLFGMETYGIISDNDIDGGGIPSVVWLTKEFRREDNMPIDYVPIAFADDGLYYVLDTGAMQNNECPVLLWEGGNVNIEKAYDSFLEYLSYEITNSDIDDEDDYEDY